MSEESAQIYKLARQSGTSSYEAWADLEDVGDAVDWDVEQMLATNLFDDSVVHPDS